MLIVPPNTAARLHLVNSNAYLLGSLPPGYTLNVPSKVPQAQSSTSFRHARKSVKARVHRYASRIFGQKESHVATGHNNRSSTHDSILLKHEPSRGVVHQDADTDSSDGVPENSCSRPVSSSSEIARGPVPLPLAKSTPLALEPQSLNGIHGGNSCYFQANRSANRSANL